MTGLGGLGGLGGQGGEGGEGGPLLVRLVRLVRPLRPLRLLRLSPGAIVLAAACSRPDPNNIRLPDNPTAKRSEDPPVAVNATSPVEYPPALFARGIEGRVLLKLFIDSTGHVSQESTRVAESSGYPALDSAALAAVPRFRFAPALRNGEPVSASFMQPVHFRHPQAGGTTP